MTDKDPRNIKRRNFLISTAALAGAGLPAWAIAASKPCPPATLSVAGGGSTTSSCQSGAGQLPVLYLTSAAPSGTHAWTFGQPFRKGDVPAGSYITADAGQFQAEVRNRWSDGSVKFAVLSGVSSFSQNQPKPISLATTTSAQVGANVAEPTSLDVAVTFSGAVTGTYTLQSVLGVNKETWGSKSNGGRVRKILGPVMSEFHYYVPTNDDHVALWFFVRRYANGATEVETVVENGWLNVAGPGQRDYTISVKVGGSTAYGPAPLAHLHHTRWSRVDWLGADPRIVPRHDGEYLKATRLVPNYGNFGQPSEATLNALVQTAEPFAQASWPDAMGTAGGGGCILNNWDALYVTSGDPRAYNSVIANSVAAGRYAIQYRDELTGRPPAYAQYMALAYGSNSSIASAGPGSATMPANGGTAPPVYAKSHALPFGILAYLLTGRHSFCEQVEFQAQVGFFGGGSNITYEGMRIPHPAAGAFTTRGFAWAIRAMAAAIVAVPDADLNAEQYRRQLGKTFAWLHDNFAGRNNLGAVIGYSSYETSYTSYTNFMEDSLTMAVGHSYLTAHDALIGNDRSRADMFAVWRCKHIVGRMGGGGTDEHCYRDAAVYYSRIAPTNLTGTSTADFNAGLFADWGKVYASQFGPNECSTSNALNGSSGSAPSTMSTNPYSYWALVHTALAYCVDLGAPGAAAAWTRLVGATNYSPQNFANLPRWSVVPRQ